MRETNVIAPLTVGQLLYVTQLEGMWVGGHVVVEDEFRRGWVQAHQVNFHAEELRLEAVPPVDADAPFISAAMLLEKARRFDHGLLAALDNATRNEEIPPGRRLDAILRQTRAANALSHAPIASRLETRLRCQLLRYAPDDGRAPDTIAELAVFGEQATDDEWPPPGSGWLEDQYWSVRLLLAPRAAVEQKHIALDDAWATHLQELARAQISLPPAPAAKRIAEEFPQDYPPAPFPDEDDVIVLRPQLSVEPLPSVYYRRAMGYRWLRESLAGAMETPHANSLRRDLDQETQAEEHLLLELRQIESLFLGASLTSARELGLNNFPPEATEQHVGDFRNWAERLAEDADIGRDRREMIAVSEPAASGNTRVRAMLGWASRTLEVSFAQPPAVTFTGNSTSPLRPQFGTRELLLWEPVWIELDLSRPLQTTTFRAVCDAYRTRLAIESACARLSSTGR